MWDFDIDEEGLPSEEEDTIAELEQVGADLSRPMRVEHFLLFPFASLAAGAADDLRGQGFEAEFGPDEEQEAGWAVVARHRTLVTVESLSKLRAKMDALAAARGGEYDGWNIPVPEVPYVERTEPSYPEPDVDELA